MECGTSTVSKHLTWLCAVLFPLVMLLLFANALIFDVGNYRGLISAEAMPATEQLLAYYMDDAEMPDVFNENEQAHLEDVKDVIRIMQALIVILLVIFLALLPRTNPRLVLTRGFLLLLILVLVLPVIPFDTIFTEFHELFFEPGTWVFPLESTLIQYYPERLFQEIFTKILMMTLVFSAVFALFARTSLVQNNNL